MARVSKQEQLTSGFRITRGVGIAVSVGITTSITKKTITATIAEAAAHAR